MNYDNTLATLRFVKSHYPLATPAEPCFDREEPAKALLTALKRMCVSHDNIAVCATGLGVSLNPSTMTRIGSEARTPTSRVMAALCLVWAAASEMLRRGAEEPAEELVREKAEAMFLAAARAEWGRIVAS